MSISREARNALLKAIDATIEALDRGEVKAWSIIVLTKVSPDELESIRDQAPERPGQSVDGAMKVIQGGCGSDEEIGLMAAMNVLKANPKHLLQGVEMLKNGVETGTVQQKKERAPTEEQKREANSVVVDLFDRLRKGSNDSEH